MKKKMVSDSFEHSEMQQQLFDLNCTQLLLLRIIIFYITIVMTHSQWQWLQYFDSGKIDGHRFYVICSKYISSSILPVEKAYILSVHYYANIFPNTHFFLYRKYVREQQQQNSVYITVFSLAIINTYSAKEGVYFVDRTVPIHQQWQTIATK